MESIVLIKSLKTIYTHTREETRFKYLQSSPYSYTNLHIFYTNGRGITTLQLPTLKFSRWSLS